MPQANVCVGLGLQIRRSWRWELGHHLGSDYRLAQALPSI